MHNKPSSYQRAVMTRNHAFVRLLTHINGSART